MATNSFIVEVAQIFNPSKSPPDMNESHTHAEASRVGRIVEDTEHLTCKCCGLAYKKQNFNLCCSTRDFEFVGSGYVLWFSSTVYVSIVLFIAFWLNFSKLLANYDKNACEGTRETLHPCEKDWIHEYSIANFGREFDSRHVWINVVLIVFMYVLTPIFKNKLYNEQKKIDIETDTARDFTIMATYLPKMATKEEITEFFNTTLPGSKVAKVSRAYDISRLSTLIKEKKYLKHKLLNEHARFYKHEDHIHHHRDLDDHIGTRQLEQISGMPGKDEIDDIPDAKYQKCLREYLDKKKEVKEERESITRDKGELFTGIAYITFESMRDAERYVKRFSIDGRSWFLRGCKYKMKYTGPSGTEESEKRLRIDRSPEPEEVLWENLKFPFRVQLSRKFYTALLVLVVLGVTFGVMFGIKYMKYHVKKQFYGGIIEVEDGNGGHKEEYENELTEKEKELLEGISILIFIVAKIANHIFDQICARMTIHEKHYSVGQYYSSATSKTVISQFVNTTLLICIVHAILHWEEAFRIWGFGGLLTDIWFLVIFYSAVIPLLHLVKFGYIKRLIQRCCLKKHKDSKRYTQIEANHIMEGPDMNPVQCYTDIYQLLLTGLFFTPAFPITCGIFLGSLMIMYWIEKYYLLRVYSMPRLLQAEIAMDSVVFIKVGAFTLSLGHLYFDLVMIERNYADPLILVMVCVTFLMLFVPLEDVLLNIYSYSGDETEIKRSLTYTEASMHFHTDYEMSNPVSNTRAVMSHVKSIGKLKKDFFKNAQTIPVQRSKTTMIGMPSSVHPYQANSHGIIISNPYQQHANTLNVASNQNLIEIENSQRELHNADIRNAPGDLPSLKRRHHIGFQQEV